ncbi:hypothetical protein Tco_1035614, partial [Tanacetum coccineum]
MAEDGKLKIDNMMVMILDSVRCRSKTLYIRRSFRSLWEKPNLPKGHFQNQCLKLIASKDKEVNMARDSDDALVCCVENTVENRIMDSGASFHATYCKEELKRFNLRSGLKRRLISVGQLDKEGYHDWCEHVSFQRQRFRCTEGRYGSFLHNVSEDKETAEIKFCVENGIVMLKIVPKTPLQFGVAERLSRTFRAESTGIHAEAPKMLWADSVSTTYLIYAIPYVPIGLHIPEEEWRGKDTSRTLKVAQMKCDTAFGIRRVTRLSEAEMLHLRTQFIELENDNIVAEHGLSLEITQSLGGSSNTSEGSKKSESFKDSGRSDEEYSKDGASSKEGGFETPHVRRSTRESRALVRYSPSANYLLLIENGEPESFSEAFHSKESVQWKKAIIEEMVSLEKNQMCSLVRLLAGKKALQSLWIFRVQEEDVHQIGDEREVEVLRSFNCPPSELITEDGVLPERGYSQFNDVSSGYLDTLYRKSPSLAFGWFRRYQKVRALALLKG